MSKVVNFPLGDTEKTLAFIQEVQRRHSLEGFMPVTPTPQLQELDGTVIDISMSPDFYAKEVRKAIEGYLQEEAGMSGDMVQKICAALTPDGKKIKIGGREMTIGKGVLKMMDFQRLLYSEGGQWETYKQQVLNAMTKLPAASSKKQSIEWRITTHPIYRLLPSDLAGRSFTSCQSLGKNRYWEGEAKGRSADLLDPTLGIAYVNVAGQQHTPVCRNGNDYGYSFDRTSARIMFRHVQYQDTKGNRHDAMFLANCYGMKDHVPVLFSWLLEKGYTVGIPYEQKERYAHTKEKEVKHKRGFVYTAAPYSFSPSFFNYYDHSFRPLRMGSKDGALHIGGSALLYGLPEGVTPKTEIRTYPHNNPRKEGAERLTLDHNAPCAKCDTSYTIRKFPIRPGDGGEFICATCV